MQGVVDHQIDLFLADDRLSSPAFVHLAHPVDPVGFEVAPPLKDRRPRHPEHLGDLRVCHTISGHQQAFGLAHGTVG